MTTRDPLDGKLVTLIGGSGFIGTHLAQALLERGARVRIAARHPEQAFSLKALAKLGQIQFLRCNVTKDESLRHAIAGADAVAYLVGAFEGDLDTLMRDAPGQAAAIASEEGAGAFLFVSALNVDAASEVDYARTKAQGEDKVRAAFPKATIVRPSILFGEDDEFINMFAKLIAGLPALPVFGPDAKLQVVHVDDCAQAMATALGNPAAHGGKVYELAGPDVLTMGEINRMIAAAQGRDRAFIDLPDIVSRTFAKATGWMPGAPMSLDQWKLLERGSVASGDHPGIEKLGVSPRPLSLFLDKWMVRYRKHGRFAAASTTRA